ncbi:MAG: hypothetical protein LW687_12105, partial [Burkholderiaceae bacterium]|nr:hypothetical protein [Burkholderiaceae bacterium]
MGVPKIEWRENLETDRRWTAEAGPFRLSVWNHEDDIDGWVWAVQTEDDDTIWWSDIATFADDARAEAERAFEIIWKARQYDAAQKHEAELLSVAKVMYDLLVGIRQLGGHGGPVD